MAFRITCQVAHKFMALLLSYGSSCWARGGMHFINDHKLGTMEQEAATAAFGFGIVDGNDHTLEMLEDAARIQPDGHYLIEQSGQF